VSQTTLFLNLLYQRLKYRITLHGGYQEIELLVIFYRLSVVQSNQILTLFSTSSLLRKTQWMGLVFSGNGKHHLQMQMSKMQLY
jgi:hypothetical protein